MATQILKTNGATKRAEPAMSIVERLHGLLHAVGTVSRKQLGALVPLAALPLFVTASLLAADSLDAWGVLVAMAPALFYSGYAISAVKAIERRVTRRHERLEAEVIRRVDEFAPNEVRQSRHFFEARLGQEIKRSRRHKLPLCVVTMSTAPARDKAVFTSELVNLTARVLRAEDSMGRLGRNLYAISLPHTSPAGAEVVVERLERELGGRGAQFGLAFLQPGRDATPRLLIDMALEASAA
jgi:hypothetical protein